MDRDEALKLLNGGEMGIRQWNQRRADGEAIPDLREADRYSADLRGVNLGDADLTLAGLRMANLRQANLSGANLSKADVGGTDLTLADLSEANLSKAELIRAKLSDTNLSGANLSGARRRLTIFADVDLSEVRGLDSVIHPGPSTIGTDTLFRSKGKIPEAFLRGCGMPETLIEYVPSILALTQPIQFYSCFISYSTRDEDFAKRLHARMVQEKLRVWFAPEDIQGGKKLPEQLDLAIQVHDRLLLVLSMHSMNSDWAGMR